MLKCKYNEDCSHYPMCGKTCGLSLEELGMPTECESADEYEEGCSCRYYDDEDK